MEVFKRIRFLKLFRFSHQVSVIAVETVCNINCAKDGHSACLNELLQHRNNVILYEQIFTYQVFMHTDHTDY